MKYFYIIVFLVFVSCKKKEPKVIETEVPVEALSLFNEKNEYSFDEKINEDIKDKIKEWDEYFTVADYLENNYATISPALSLEMSKELVDLVEKMNDSLQIKTLNNREVFARLNTLNSEVLRLKDMSTISSIKASEVAIQVEKVVAVFNSVNSKINSVYSQQNFDENVDFDETIFNFNKAAETPYSVPKKRRRKRTNSSQIDPKSVQK